MAGIVITSFLLPRFEHADNKKLAGALLWLTIGLTISMVIFGLASSFALASVAYLVARLARRLKDPLYVTWLNKNVEDSSVRATVNSIASQSDAIGEVAGGPVIGVVGTLASLRAALVAAGLVARVVDQEVHVGKALGQLADGFGLDVGYGPAGHVVVHDRQAARIGRRGQPRPDRLRQGQRLGPHLLGRPGREC